MSNRKKLLQINTVVNFGSTGHIVEELGQKAIDDGWESYIAFGRFDRPSKSETIKIGTYFEIILHGFQTRIFDRHGFGSRNATENLVNQIDELKPDIIHLHNLHGYYLNIEVLFNFLKVKNIPVVWSFHDCWPMTGHCPYFDSVGCNKWETCCFSCPQKNEYPSSFGFDGSKRNFKFKRKLFTSLSNLTIVPVSKWLGDIVKKSYFKKFPVQIISNGIDTDVFHPFQDSCIRDEYKLNNEFIILGVAQKWEPRKGLKDFIQLSMKLDSTYQIILVGLNKSQIKALPASIIGIERTESTQELVNLYSIADVYANLSVEESFGLTTAEAMSCGTPVIVYNSTANPELVTLETGIVTERRDIDGVARAVKKVRENGKSFYSQACVSRVRELYNNSDRGQDYVRLYNYLLNK